MFSIQTYLINKKSTCYLWTVILRVDHRNTPTGRSVIYCLNKMFGQSCPRIEGKLNKTDFSRISSLKMCYQKSSNYWQIRSKLVNDSVPLKWMLKEFFIFIAKAVSFSENYLDNKSWEDGPLCKNVACSVLLGDVMKRALHKSFPLLSKLHPIKILSWYFMWQMIY